MRGVRGGLPRGDRASPGRAGTGPHSLRRFRASRPLSRRAKGVASPTAETGQFLLAWVAFPVPKNVTPGAAPREFRRAGRLNAILAKKNHASRTFCCIRLARCDRLHAGDCGPEGAGCRWRVAATETLCTPSEVRRRFGDF